MHQNGVICFFLQTDLRALEAPVSMFSPSSLTNQSIRTKCLCDGRRQSISNRAETKKKKKKEGERKRVMEEGRETDWTGEMGGKQEGWLSEKSVYVCVWSPLTSAEWPLRWGLRHPGPSPGYDGGGGGGGGGGIWLVKWTSNRRCWSNACTHMHRTHARTHTHTHITTHTQASPREPFFWSSSPSNTASLSVTLVCLRPVEGDSSNNWNK